MNDFLRKHGKNIVIGIFVLLFLNRCTVACNRDNKLDNAQVTIEQNDSVISSLNDSIKYLNAEINIRNEKISGMEQSAKIQNDALNKIVEAKKNISVNVKTNGK